MLSVEKKLCRGIGILYERLSNLRRADIDVVIVRSSRKKDKVMLVTTEGSLFVKYRVLDNPCDKDVEEAILKESLNIDLPKMTLLEFIISIVLGVVLAIMIFGVSRVAVSISIGFVVAIFCIAVIIGSIISTLTIRRGRKLHRELIIRNAIYKWQFEHVKNIITKVIGEALRIVEGLPHTRDVSSVSIDGMTFRVRIRRRIFGYRVEFSRTF